MYTSYPPYDILQAIFDKLDFILQIRFRQCDLSNYDILHVTNFYNVSTRIKRKYTDQILLNYPFIKYLDCYCNEHVTNINHLGNLRVLNAGNICHSHVELNVQENNHIFKCGIDQNGIEKLCNLEILYADNNPKITSISNFKNLRKLAIRNCSGIDQKAISQVYEITMLDASNNYTVFDVNHLVKLRILYANDDCGIYQKGIDKLSNLNELECTGNWKITRHFSQQSKTCKCPSYDNTYKTHCCNYHMNFGNGYIVSTYIP